MSPAVSIIIPCYNADRWISATLSSVFSSTSLPIEVIVVDDGSTDASAQSVRDYSNVNLIRSSNQGVSFARNLGFKASSASLVVFLDADDLLLPGVLDQQVNVLQDSDADIVYSNWQRLVERENGTFENGELVNVDMGDDAGVAIMRGVWCPLGAYLIRRQLVSDVGGFDVTQSVLADCRFLFQCVMKAKLIVRNPNTCCLYRVHLKGKSMATRCTRLFFDECLRNAELAREWWISCGVFDAPRQDIYLRVMDFIARGTARHHPELFAIACKLIEEKVGRFIPFGLLPTRLAIAGIGYSRYRWIQSFFSR